MYFALNIDLTASKFFKMFIMMENVDLIKLRGSFKTYFLSD
jgi:hypothetical protein